MKLRAVWIGKTKESAIRALTEEYGKRIARANAFEGAELANEDAVLKLLERSGRTAPVFVTMDPRGKMLSSEQLAEFLRSHLERGTQELIFAIGPADGWSERAKKAANNLISFGPITLPHELARVVLLEQLYRGFCILQGHPYHDGH